VISQVKMRLYWNRMCPGAEWLAPVRGEMMQTHGGECHMKTGKVTRGPQKQRLELHSCKPRNHKDCQLLPETRRMPWDKFLSLQKGTHLLIPWLQPCVSDTFDVPPQPSWSHLLLILATAL
jgi:hypothetical protein